MIDNYVHTGNHSTEEEACDRNVFMRRVLYSTLCFPAFISLLPGFIYIPINNPTLLSSRYYICIVIG